MISLDDITHVTAIWFDTTQNAREFRTRQLVGGHIFAATPCSDETGPAVWFPARTTQGDIFNHPMLRHLDGGIV